jgi:RNA polymerase sigma-70 factor (ECF subfamily)
LQHADRVSSKRWRAAALGTERECHVSEAWDEYRVMSPRDSRSDAELLAATPGDPDAFATFYRRHVPGVLAFVARHAEWDDVNDLVAEVFATALVHRRRFDPARGSAGAWLAGIARHKIADARRRGEVEARMCRRLGIRLPARTGELELDHGAELLGALPADQRRAVKARVLDEKPYAQIAREQSVSEQALRKRVSRALAALRPHVGEEP